MFSLIEKIKFILTTKTTLPRLRKKSTQKEKPRGKWVSFARKTLIVIAAIFGFLILLGLFVSYTMPPSIHVNYSHDKKVHTTSSPTTITGYISSGRESTLKINGQDVELISGDFAHEVSLEKGDNKFILEATNSLGTTKELYIINYDTKI